MALSFRTFLVPSLLWEAKLVREPYADESAGSGPWVSGRIGAADQVNPIAEACGWRIDSQGGRPGRPRIDPELRELIRRISRANSACGSPRIVGELAKLEIVVAKSTVEKYRFRANGSPSPTWRACLEDHVLQRHYERRAA